ncbi:MAG: tRNA preQ1(34) S-adenosylmethionine ribosyltransferase-isomerase QueA [Arcobacter sp.]|nr:MAG: tRNA preQ1(34) S-adenosylmethionine ribosyltransferase-isomerase QueA [Arcobacter sp.]
MDPLKTESYDYTLPQELIATIPASPRDSCKLLVFNRVDQSITHTVFSKIDSYLPKDCAILCNDTKVIKARIFGKKPTGGKVELLINKPLNFTEVSCLIRGKIHVGMELTFDESLLAEVKELKEDGSRIVVFSQDEKTLSFEELILVLDKIGHIPLPPYIDREDNKDDEDEYQSVFSQNAGAVAAPTASLHFTPELFEDIKSKHQTEFLTLHVGAGTFKPVEADIITDHPMHSEYYHIPASALELIASKKPLLAIGTTVTRTVEFFARTQKSEGEANLFLHPNNPPVRINHLLTNFHLPKSTLLMLVASFVGLEQSQKIYQEAIEKKYRFFSYGDAMLII